MTHATQPAAASAPAGCPWTSAEAEAGMGRCGSMRIVADLLAPIEAEERGRRIAIHGPARSAFDGRLGVRDRVAAADERSRLGG